MIEKYRFFFQQKSHDILSNLEHFPVEKKICQVCHDFSCKKIEIVALNICICFNVDFFHDIEVI